jgi:hypothetical protein
MTPNPMKTSDYLRLALALGLGAMIALSVFTAGAFAVAAAGLVTTFLSAILIIVLGGRRRVSLMAIALVPPFVLISSYEIFYLSRESPLNPEPFPNVFTYYLAEFGLLVALPIFIAYIVSLVTRLNHKAPKA